MITKKSLNDYRRLVKEVERYSLRKGNCWERLERVATKLELPPTLLFNMMFDSALMCLESDNTLTFPLRFQVDLEELNRLN